MEQTPDNLQKTLTLLEIEYLPITLDSPGKAFAKHRDRLPEEMKESLEEVIQELRTNTLKPGRKFKKLKNKDGDFFEVRLNKQYRFVFEIYAPGKGIHLAVGTHKQVGT